MLSNICFLFLVSSGSAFAAVAFNRKYEETLPLTFTGIILIQFIAGIFGKLEAGFYIVLLTGILLWLMPTIMLFMNRIKTGFLPERCQEIKRRFLSNFFSIGFWIYFIYFIFLLFALHGMVLHETDEYSHWGVVVKAMLQINDFGTNPEAKLGFGSYPPGIALVQWFFQKLHLFLSHEKAFSEWRLYLAYDMLLMAFLISLLAKVKCKNNGKKFCLFIMLFLSPYIFYSNIYHTLYVDAFLGIISGCGLAAVILKDRQHDHYYDLYLFSVCFMLTLTKSSGFLFAVIIVLSAAIIERYKKNLSKKYLPTFIIISLGSIVIPQIMWQINIFLSGCVTANSNTIDLKQLIACFLGKDETYRQHILKTFPKLLFDCSITAENKNFPLGNTNITISYFLLLLVGGLIFYMAYFIAKPRDKKFAFSIKTVGLLSFIQWLIFYIGLCLTYMFKFTEYQGTNFHSYARYTHTLYLSICIVLLIIIFKTIEISFERTSTPLTVMAACILAMVTPFRDVEDFISRDISNASMEARAPYDAFATVVLDAIIDTDSNICIIGQDFTYSTSALLLNYNLSFLLRPMSVETKIFTEDTRYLGASNEGPDELMALLIEKYDYVAIYAYDDFFFTNYSELFENPSNIAANGIYFIDKQRKILSRIN